MDGSTPLGDMMNTSNVVINDQEDMILILKTVNMVAFFLAHVNRLRFIRMI